MTMGSHEACRCDVAIVGGGLGGLIAAHALRRAKPDINVKIFEQFPTYKKAGALLAVAANTQKALQAIDPDVLKQTVAASIADGRSLRYNNKGELTVECHTSDMFGQFDTKTLKGASSGIKLTPLRMGWWEMHQTMVACQPPGSVIFNSKFRRFRETADEVMLEFEGSGKGHNDGEGTAGRWSAKLLIGADGAFSAVRQQLLNDGKPSNAGSVIWRARLPASALSRLLNNGIIERSFIGDGRACNIWLVNDKTMEGCWTCSTNKDVLKDMGVSFDNDPGARTGQQVLPVGNNAKERVMRLMKDYPDMVTETIAATDPNMIAEHGVWVREVKEPWGRGRVSLCGDAAHPVRPTTGQGFGQAAEDAHALAVAIREQGLTAEALRSFEDTRWQRTSHVAAIEQVVANAAYKRQPMPEEKAEDPRQRQLDYQQFLLDYDLAPL